MIISALLVKYYILPTLQFLNDYALIVDRLPEVHALHDVLDNIISTSYNPLFVQHNLISLATASDIMSRMGSSNRDKAMQFYKSKAPV